jgi:outer membrane protein OmpA-like peptidoglycan-associated protein
MCNNKTVINQCTLKIKIQYQTIFMLVFHSRKQKTALLFLGLILAGSRIGAQQLNRTEPIWWFGESAAANLNYYRGTTQMLNENVTVPTAFHKGSGVKPYFSLLTEYRPNKKWGGMLNIAYDNRGGKFDDVVAPCNCPAELKTNISYIAIEPSLRLAPFASSFYIFAGPTISYNVAKSFTYKQEKQEDRTADWSNVHKTAFSAQAGAGIDLMLSAPSNTTQVSLSPFVSFLTDLGHEPRANQTWSFYTVRAGVALKIGSRKRKKDIPSTVEEQKVNFSVRAPRLVSPNRPVKETFPLCNSVFFNMGSVEIPGRYLMLNSAQAKAFREEELQDSQPANLNSGRSSRQLAVYHNILNILGDRLRSNPKSTITLVGASDKNPAEGKQMAEKIKDYLVETFNIGASRIITEGRDKPLIPSEQPDAKKELSLLREGDRRVDIISTSNELLMQVGGSASPFLKPVQIEAIQQDPLDSHVIFNALGASELLKSWTIEVTDEKGAVQHYGPFTKDQASVPGKTILGNDKQGNYKVVMLGESNTGKTVKAESSVSLLKTDDEKQVGRRYSILFDFDKSKSISTYESFLTNVVVPLIPENGTVIIHGHSDVIGEENYNVSLSLERAVGAQKIMEAALLKAGKKGVNFETFGFGEDTGMAPFENNLPEERFYNRTVIIDIVPQK